MSYDFEEESIKREKSIKRVGTIMLMIFIGILLVICCVRSCTIVGPTEEAVKKSFGVVAEENYAPGLHFCWPVGEEFIKYDHNPIQYNKDIPSDERALITKDQQSIGISFVLTWRYKQGSAYKLATTYSTEAALYNIISDPCKQAFHDEVGRIDASELVKDQQGLVDKVVARVKESCVRLDVPVDILMVTIENITWDPEYEDQIKKNANLKAEVEEANLRTEKTAAQSQEQVKIAAAAADAAVEEARQKEAEAAGEANATFIRAQKEAEAKKITADAELYYAEQLARAGAMKKAEWEHEEKMLELEKWDGRKVTDYIPITANGQIVGLPNTGN